MKRSALLRRTHMKRAPVPAKPPRERSPLVLVARPADARKGVMSRSHEVCAAQPKDGTYRSELWRRAVASLPCVLCGRQGETQCAHRNETKAMGMKVSDAWTAALCAACHRDIDQGSQHTKAERRERLDKAILLTVRELVHRGLLIPQPA